MSELSDDPLMLAQLLCTRLCHDLAGPIGAVAAGVELTAGDPAQVDAETLGLIGNSSSAASRKLKFLRAAFGMPGAPTATLGELGTLTEGYLSATAGRNGPPALNWPTQADIAELANTLGPATVPLLLNVLLLVLEAQAACRKLTLTISATPGVRIVASAEGDPQRASEWRSEVQAAIAGQPGTPSAKSIQAHFLHQVAANLGKRIALSTEGSIVIATVIIS